MTCGRKMIDSGVEWIGEIPEGWAIQRTLDLFSFKKEINYGMKEENRLSLTMSGVLRRSLDDNDGLQSSSYEGYQIFEEGDLAFKLIDLQNIKTSRVGLVPERGIMSPAYIRLSPRAGTNQKFFYYFMLSAYNLNVFNDMGGGVRQTMNKDDILGFEVVSPSPNEQNSIVAFLDDLTWNIDKEISLLSRKHDALAEKRKALIFEAVTGKLDIHG